MKLDLYSQHRLTAHRNWAYCFLVLFIAGVLSGCGSPPDLSQADEPTQQEKSVPQSVVPLAPKRVKSAEDVLVRFRDDGAIPESMVDDITRVLQEGDANHLEPLLKRIDLMSQSGDIYAEDFVLWWQKRGRSELGSHILWRRDLLIQAMELVFVSNNDKDKNEELMISLLTRAAETGDPVAMLWSTLANKASDASLPQVDGYEWSSIVVEVIDLAEAGDPEAAFFIGMMGMKRAISVQVAPGKALTWLEIAAEGGNLAAMRELVEIYGGTRRGFSENSAKANMWADRLTDASPDSP